MASTNPPSQANHYIRRLASSSYQCLVCSRLSSIILVSNSIPTQDWFATCQSHLADRHFATRLKPNSTTQSEAIAIVGTGERSLSSKVSKEEIEKVKKEWEEREKAKKEKQKEKEKEKEKESEKDKQKKENEKSWLETLSSPFSASGSEEVKPSGRGATASTPTPTTTTTNSAADTTGPKEHERYALHRDFYLMRVEERKKREAIKRAKELKMPVAPKGGLV